ncbi:MAG TPA: plasmid pRiA4b ORF-3 family protein [Clostridia bacterium]|nr:plasmid pRiA4b ORF-3 family protein [Clostridia bacterium]
MQIALTKKLADVMAVKSLAPLDEENPLFSWTANWTKVWDNRRADDTLVLVNNATRFAVGIYEVKRKDLKKNPKITAQMMRDAISNTLLATNYNPELVEEYMRLAGEVEFVRNQNRQTTSWIVKAGLMCVNYIAHEYNGIEKMYSDTIGVRVNRLFVNYSGKNKDLFYPCEVMAKALSELSEKPIYKYRAFELLVSLDLEVYKAVRRIIVPANLEFIKLHKILQSIYNWKDYHLYDFVIMDDKDPEAATLIVPYEEDLEYNEDAVLMKGLVLSDFLPESKRILYTYDMGDCWSHKIQLVRVLEDYDKESPYLLEARGQSPPEDVGGLGGFLEFRKIMMDPNHPQYEETLEWVGYWSWDLPSWQSYPGFIDV